MIYVLNTMKILIKQILNLKLKFKSKYKNIFDKGYAPNWLEEIFVVIKNTVPWTYVVSDLNGEEITGSF